MAKRKNAVYGKNKLKPIYALNVATGIAFKAENDGMILKVRRSKKYEILTKVEFDQHGKNEMQICEDAQKQYGKTNFNKKWLGKKRYDEAIAKADPKFKREVIANAKDGVPENVEMKESVLMRFTLKDLTDYCSDQSIEFNGTTKKEIVEEIIVASKKEEE